MSLRYLDLTTTDPDYNLAVEQYVFDSLPKEHTYLMLWQNDNAIIIGKHQNTLAEINAAYVQEKGIRVVRRLSGGGAVYHDMGNLNFTLITDDAGSSQIDFHRFCLPVIRALAKVGITAEVNGRNDMTIEGKKFSGNAQYRRNGRVMHHGTILFDSDPGVLASALQVDEEKIKAKGVKSVRSRVTNVRPLLPVDMTLPQFRQVLLESILQEMPGESYTLTPQDQAAIEAIRANRYGTWEWNYGQSPACDLVKRRRFEGCGTVQAYIRLKHGVIEDITFRGDFFSNADPDTLPLTGIPLEKTALAQALGGVDTAMYFHGLTTEQLVELLTL